MRRGEGGGVEVPALAAAVKPKGVGLAWLAALVELASHWHRAESMRSLSGDAAAPAIEHTDGMWVTVTLATRSAPGKVACSPGRLLIWIGKAVWSAWRSEAVRASAQVSTASAAKLVDTLHAGNTQF
jgi:hypothetical protein